MVTNGKKNKTIFSKAREVINYVNCLCKRDAKDKSVRLSFISIWTHFLKKKVFNIT
jgi:hypothetical protein